MESKPVAGPVLSGQASSPLRFWLGMLQIAGSGLAVGLFVRSGLSAAMLITTLITTVISLTSVVLRRRQPPV